MQLSGIITASGASGRPTAQGYIGADVQGLPIINHLTVLGAYELYGKLSGHLLTRVTGLNERLAIPSISPPKP